MTVPEPDEYEIRYVDRVFEKRVVAHYPNMSMTTSVEGDGLYSNIEEKRREELEYDECENCNPELSLDDTYAPCNDCFQAALDAIDSWAAENTDKLLGDNID